MLTELALVILPIVGGDLRFLPDDFFAFEPLLEAVDMDAPHRSSALTRRDKGIVRLVHVLGRETNPTGLQLS
jgi:hypothetical protein